MYDPRPVLALRVFAPSLIDGLRSMKLPKTVLHFSWPLIACAAFGCSDPWLHVQRLNPYVTKGWAEDEAYLATLHTKLKAVEEIRWELASLEPQVQQEWSRTLTHIIENDDNALLRAAAVKTLAQLPGPLAEPGLSKALEDSAASVRVAACEAWCQHDANHAVEHLARVLGSDTHLDVQLAAAKGLGKLDDPRAITALGLALDSKDPALQYRASRSLAQLTPVDFGRDVVAWKKYLKGEPVSPPQSSWSSLVRLPWSPWR